MSSVYEAIGRLVVDSVRLRYERQLRLAAGAGAFAVAALIVGAHLSKGDEEG